jgi:hypothetical protein
LSGCGMRCRPLASGSAKTQNEQEAQKKQKQAKKGISNCEPIDGAADG